MTALGASGCVWVLSGCVHTRFGLLTQSGPRLKEAFSYLYDQQPHGIPEKMIQRYYGHDDIMGYEDELRRL